MNVDHPIKWFQLAKVLWMDSFISFFHMQSEIKLVLEKTSVHWFDSPIITSSIHTSLRGAGSYNKKFRCISEVDINVWNKCTFSPIRICRTFDLKTHFGKFAWHKCTFLPGKICRTFYLQNHFFGKFAWHDQSFSSLITNSIFQKKLKF